MRDFFLILMQHSIIEQIKAIVQPIVDQHNAFLVDVNVRGERSSKVVEIFVDTDDGISLDICSAISRELSTQLDQVNIIQGRYRLDVSSPGLDKPLKLLRQYPKNVGRYCKIIFEHDGKRTTSEGVLEHVSENSVTVIHKGIPQEVEFTNIIETYIIPKI